MAILTIILMVALFLSIAYLLTKRKEKGITGFKTALTPLCFYLIAIINVIAIWINTLGLIVWDIKHRLIIFGILFLKIFPRSKARKLIFKGFFGQSHLLFPQLRQLQKHLLQRSLLSGTYQGCGRYLRLKRFLQAEARLNLAPSQA